MAIQDGWPTRPAKPYRHRHHGDPEHQPDESQHSSAERSRLPHSQSVGAGFQPTPNLPTGPTRDLGDDVGNRCVVGADKIVDLDKCAVAVSTSAECGAVADQPLVDDHRPARVAADRGDRAAFVSSRLQSLSCIGEFHLADAEQQPQLGPGNLRATRDDGEQVTPARAANHDRLGHVRRRDTQQLGCLLEAARNWPASQLDSQSALIGISQHASYARCQLIVHDHPL